MQLRAANGFLPEKLQGYVNDLCEKIEKALSTDERISFEQPIPENILEEIGRHGY